MQTIKDKIPPERAIRYFLKLRKPAVGTMASRIAWAQEKLSQNAIGQLKAQHFCTVRRMKKRTDPIRSLRLTKAALTAAPWQGPFATWDAAEESIRISLLGALQDGQWHRLSEHPNPEPSQNLRDVLAGSINTPLEPSEIALLIDHTLDTLQRDGTMEARRTDDDSENEFRLVKGPHEGPTDPSAPPEVSTPIVVECPASVGVEPLPPVAVNPAEDPTPTPDPDDLDPSLRSMLRKPFFT